MLLPRLSRIPRLTLFLLLFLDPDVYAFHAGTTTKDGQVVTDGGRVMAVSAFAPTLRGAVDAAYEGVKQVSFEGMTYRKDIAYRSVLTYTRFEAHRAVV